MSILTVSSNKNVITGAEQQNAVKENTSENRTELLLMNYQTGIIDAQLLTRMRWKQV